MGDVTMSDRHPRTKHEVSTANAVARALAANGVSEALPSEQELAEWRADRDRRAAEERAPAQSARARHDVRARFDAMVALGWPVRACEHAMHAKSTNGIEAIRGWHPHHCGIVLAGPKGTGKTVAAAWHAMFDVSPRIMRFVRASTLLRTSRFSDAFAAFVDVPSLCIDDLGAEYADEKGSFVASIDELIDKMYADRRQLIITTNLDGAAFADRYGTRVIDRIEECVTWASVEGESMRARQPAPWET